MDSNNMVTGIGLQCYKNSFKTDLNNYQDYTNDRQHIEQIRMKKVDYAKKEIIV